MAHRDEQVARIEAALKGRFFDHVPKIESPERGNWTDDQHDVDRLTRALAAYVLVHECDIDEVTAAGLITDGGDDGGIDALYFHRPANRLYFIQSKYKRSGTSPAQDEVLKTLNGIRDVQARRFGGFNAAVQLRLDEIEEALDTATVKIHVVITYLGDNFNTHAESDLNKFAGDLNKYGPRCEWQPVGLSKIHDWLLTEQVPPTVNGQIHLENWGGVLAPRRAFYGQISAADLARLVENHGKALFERNIRHYLGSVGVNTAIERTVRTRPGDFFYLNNGITAIAKVVTPGPGTEARCPFQLEEVSIVNGAQTAGAIASAAIAGALSPDAKLLITIIQVDPATDDFGFKVTRARNHQNVVRGVDFAALDPTQERLRQELAMAGITYFYRPSAEARARRDDACTLEEAAIALACITFEPLDAEEASRRGAMNGVDFVLTAKKEVGRLWEQEGQLYGRLFPGTLTGAKAYRAVLVYRFIDQIMAASEQSELVYDRKMFFRHARYFVISFVALRSRAVVARQSLTLSTEDRNYLSRQVNELAELIYATTRETDTYKGQLAIFRNLGDAQPVADRVLAKLRAADALALDVATGR
jgi:hypothetical protein